MQEEEELKTDWPAEFAELLDFGHNWAHSSAQQRTYGTTKLVSTREFRKSETL